MKIAVLADIHANYRALETVIDHMERWKPDKVFVAGDIINRGPRSKCCLQLIQDKANNHGWQVIRGNHEDYVIERNNPNDPKFGTIYKLFQPVHFTYNQLNQDISQLQKLPQQISIEVESAGEVRMLHASMLGNRDGIYPETTNNDLAKRIFPPPAVFITGHTHRSLIRKLNGSLIVNAGSVGLPFDGDTRSAYAQITSHQGNWEAKIVRLPYNQQLAEQDFIDYGFSEGGGPLVHLILMELKTGLGQLYQWVSKYNQLIINEKITVENAVNEFLQNPITKPYWKSY